MLQLTVQNGAMLMSDVPKDAGRTKSKSDLYRTNAQKKVEHIFESSILIFFPDFFKFQIWT